MTKQPCRQFLSYSASPALALPRPAKRVIVLLVDLGLCILTVWLAFYLRLGEMVALTGNALWVVLASAGLALPIFILSGLYRAIFRFNGWPALIAVGRAVSVYGILFAAVFTAIGVQDVPRTIGIIQPILLLFFVGASRAFARYWLGNQYQSIWKRAERPKVLVYGAGSAGRQLVDALANNPEMQVVGFLDDDDRLYGHVLNGKPIHNPVDLPQLVNALRIKGVLLAMPRLTRQRRNEIVSAMRGAHVSVRTLPSLSDLAHGRVSVADLRELDIDDLLEREVVAPNHLLLSMNIRKRTVMVTGAGGSIGSELCRQVLSLGPERLLLVEQSEFALYEVHQELIGKTDGKDAVLVPLLASVQDAERMREIMETWRPDTVYHAAAYKHVPLVEHNPAEGIKNNVIGTLRTALAAAEFGVSDFVLVSTDKAVRPTNIMGASKRLAELVLQALSKVHPKTSFSMVRFGNVLGSSGSVVPKFRQQIREGGPITVTHPEVTRYFMTIPEAAQLVIQAGAMAKGGDVFVLDMGESVKVMDLARRMVELSGLSVRDEENPEGDIGIQVVGLRPGEKLYEELLIGDNPMATSHPRIMRAKEEFIAWDELAVKLRALEMALSVNDVGLILAMLRELVDGYSPSETIVDWVHLEQEVDVSGAGPT
jgi:FlaA1/EpsC-like NDP-sugar epimerase